MPRTASDGLPRIVRAETTLCSSDGNPTHDPQLGNASDPLARGSVGC